MKNYVKYLGNLFDKNLFWKIHIDNKATKLRKTVGLIAKLRLWFDNMGKGVSKTHLTKVFLLEKKNYPDLYFLPTGMIMPFLFLLMQISCQLPFSILSLYLT